MNLTIKKEDVSINPDGSIAIINPELKAKVAEISTEPEESVKHINNGCNLVKGCGSALR